MNKADIKRVADGLNHNQKYTLRRALCEGEEQRQEKGKKTLRSADCVLDYHGARGNAPSIRALIRRGLMAPGWRNALTTDGLKVARYVFEEQWLRESDTVAEIETDIPGVTYRPTTVEEYVAGYLAERKRVEQERADLIKRAKYLWRGISLPEPYDYGSRSKTMAHAIQSEFTERYGRREGINMGLERLVHIGEQIEAMRDAS